jgi:hypothetical protein
VLDEAGRGRVVEAHRRDAGGGVHRVGVDPEFLADVVLQQPVDDDHVAPDELLPRRDPLADDLPVVGDNLQVEVRDEDAGVALAARRLADVAEAAAEGEVAPLDDVLELRPVHRRGDRIDEGRVTLELGELEGRPEGAHDRPDQVGQDVLRMVELGAGEEAGVAGDVGDDEAGGLWLVEHRWGVPRAAIHHRPFAGPCHGSGTPGFAAGPPPDQTRADVALRRHLLAIRR